MPGAVYYSYFTAVSGTGTAIGTADVGGIDVPVSWTQGGGWVNLGLMGDATTGVTAGISDDAIKIVGSFTMLDGSQHGGIYSSGVWTDIGIPVGMQSIYPAEISPNGNKIALLAMDSLGNSYTYSYDTTTDTFTEVVSNAALSSNPFSIANAGIMSGIATNPADSLYESALFSAPPTPPTTQYYVDYVLNEPKLIGTVNQVDSAATLYPAYLIPINLRPPYIGIDILETEALASAPFIDQNGNHDQLMKDKVRITLYGFGNNTSLDFLDFVLGYSLEYGNIGILNMPRIKDEKRTQAELQIIAAKKTIELEVSYYQSKSQEVARQLILHCFPNFVFT